MSAKKRVKAKTVVHGECDSSSKRIEAACAILNDGIIALPADAKDWCCEHVTIARSCIAAAVDVA